jgi:hypothetical protein
LSSTAQEDPEVSRPPMGELIERITALQAAHTLDPAREREADLSPGAGLPLRRRHPPG